MKATYRQFSCNGNMTILRLDKKETQMNGAETKKRIHKDLFTGDGMQ